MSPRTDIHAPSSPDFDSEAYFCAGVFDFHPEEGNGRDRMRTVSALVSKGYRFTSVHSSDQCGHCGARIRYGALMVHEATKGMIYVGETCLTNRFEELTKGEFQALRKAALLNRERTLKAERLAAVLADAPVLVWASYAYNIGAAGGVVESEDNGYGGTYDTIRGGWEEQAKAGWEISTLSDIWGKVQQYCDPSPKQIAFVENLVNKLNQKQTWLEEREAKAAALKASGVKAPEGRVQVTGKVLMTKVYETEGYGYYATTVSTLKMLVELADGAKVFGTVPSSINPSKGDTVTFTATFTPKADDTTFAIYKRPSKATMITQEEVAA